MELAALLVLGFVAGTAGGLVGLGGSVVMIPVLTVVLDRNQHLSQAAAMIINVVIAVPSVIRHHQARALRWDVIARMLPLAVVCIVGGVATSNIADAELLKKIFGGFLLYVMVTKIAQIYRERNGVTPREPQVGWWRTGFVGGSMGAVAGLLGTGGGPIAVPLLQRVCHLPLRQAIAASSAVMCVTSTIGSVQKNMTLGSLTAADGQSLGLSVIDSLWIAGWIAPTAVLGAMFGAELTHRLPLGIVRIAFVIIITAAALKMLGVF